MKRGEPIGSVGLKDLVFYCDRNNNREVCSGIVMVVTQDHVILKSGYILSCHDDLAEVFDEANAKLESEFLKMCDLKYGPRFYNERHKKRGHHATA